MKGKYEIQPIPGHPVPEWRTQFDGIDYVAQSSEEAWNDYHWWVGIIYDFNHPTVKTHIAPPPFNPFSMMRIL